MVLARLLTPESFGVVALAMVFVAFFQIFVDQGMADAIIQRHEVAPHQMDTVFWLCVAFGAFLSVLSFASAGFIARALNEEDLALVIRWLAIVLIIGGIIAVPNALLRKAHDFRALAAIDIFSTVVGSAIAIAMALQGFGLLALVTQSLAKSIGNLIGQLVKVKWKPRFRFSMASAGPLFRFGLNVTGIRVLSYVNRRYDDFLIGAVLGPIALGYYTIAYRVLIALTGLITGAGHKVGFPFLSRAREETENFQKQFYSLTRFSFLVSVPAFLVLSHTATEVIAVAFGASWLPSAVLLAILAFHGLAVSSTFINGTAMLAGGYPQYKLWIMIAGTLFNVAAFSVAVHWGLVAMCVTYSARAYIFIPVELFLVNKVVALDYRRYVRAIGPPVLAGIALSVSLQIFDRYPIGSKESIVSSVLSVLTGVMIFSAVYLYLSAGSRTEYRLDGI